MKKIGYVLSGGGARGFAHLGVLKFLEESGLKPFAISGTSAGAIAGALYAAGKNPDEILALFKKSSLFSWGTFSWQKDGFFSMEVIRKMLSDAVDRDDFDVLQLKLFVVATDLIAGQSVVFSKGKFIDAVIASASVPVVFEPVKSINRIFVDGGILNNFPVEPLIGECDAIIGSFVNKIEKGIGESSFFNSITILDRCFHLAVAHSAYSKVSMCDLFIDVPLHDFDMYDVKFADQIFEIGYKTAALHKDRILEIKG